MTLPIKECDYQVVSVQRLGPHILQALFEPCVDDAIVFQAGQYIEIQDERGACFPFSIANAPQADQRIELHIRHSPESNYPNALIDRINKRAKLHFIGPFGNNVLQADKQLPTLFVAGGSGFAPHKAIIEQLLTSKLTQDVHLFWGARNKSDLYYHDVIESWLQREPLFSYTPVLSEPTDSDAWQGETGLVHEVAARFFPDLSGHQAFLAGPEPMVMKALASFTAQGCLRENIYSDVLDLISDV